MGFQPLVSYGQGGLAALHGAHPPIVAQPVLLGVLGTCLVMSGQQKLWHASLLLTKPEPRSQQSTCSGQSIGSTMKCFAGAEDLFRNDQHPKPTLNPKLYNPNHPSWKIHSSSCLPLEAVMLGSDIRTAAKTQPPSSVEWLFSPALCRRVIISLSSMLLWMFFVVLDVACVIFCVLPRCPCDANLLHTPALNKPATA